MPCLPPRRSSSRRCWWNRYSDSSRPHRLQAHLPRRADRVADAKVRAEPRQARVRVARAEPKLARAEPKLARAEPKLARVVARAGRVAAVVEDAAAGPALRLPRRRETRKAA